MVIGLRPGGRARRLLTGPCGAGHAGLGVSGHRKATGGRENLMGSPKVRTEVLSLCPERVQSQSFTKPYTLVRLAKQRVIGLEANMALFSSYAG